MGISSLGDRKDILSEIEKHKEKTEQILKTSGGLDASENENHEVVLQKKLAKGSFGSVYSAYWKNKLCAVKIIHISEISNDANTRVIREIEIMRDVQNPYIVQYLGCAQLSNSLQIFMELCKYNMCEYLQELACQNKRISVYNLHKCCTNIAQGLHYLHSLDPPIIHRDLKGKNILINYVNGEIESAKICDFGISKILSEDTVANTFLGTFRYMSPEILANTHPYSIESDIWSFGMVLYELISMGKMPYYEESKNEDVTKKIKLGIKPTVPLPYQKPIQIQFYIDLMESCLHLSPGFRPAIGEIVDDLNNKKIEEYEDENLSTIVELKSS